MKDDKTVFIETLDVPEELIPHLHHMLTDGEMALLNYLAGEETELADIEAEFPAGTPARVESLFNRGYLDRQVKEDKRYYSSGTFEQIFKRFVNHSPRFHRLPEKEKQLFRDYFRELYLDKMRRSDKPLYRVIPIGKTIKDKRQLVPYDQALHYLRQASAMSVIDCICRTSRQKCRSPLNVCIAFGSQAEFFIDRGIGEEIDIDRGMSILRTAEDHGLVHSINNREDPNFLCHCCRCCCVFVQGLKEFGIETSIGKSGFTAALDGDGCNGCGLCAERCMFGAVSLENGIPRFEKNRCFGCGLCAYACPADAIRLSKNGAPREVSG